MSKIEEIISVALFALIVGVITEKFIEQYSNIILIVSLLGLSFLFVKNILEYYFKKINSIKIKLLKENFTPGAKSPSIKFEIENRWEKSISIEPIILFTAISFRPWDKKAIRKKYKSEFEIETLDRLLIPKLPKELIAFSKEDSNLLGFSWFKTYILKFSTSQKKYMRYRSADMVNLSFLQYYYELALSYFGHLKVRKITEIE